MNPYDPDPLYVEPDDEPDSGMVLVYLLAAALGVGLLAMWWVTR